MKHFKSTMTTDQAKKHYYFLAKKNHPDVGGKTETMQEITAEYTAFLKTKNYDFGNFKKDHSDHYSRFSDMFDELLKKEMEKSKDKNLEKFMESHGEMVKLVGYGLFMFAETIGTRRGYKRPTAKTDMKKQ